MLGYEKTKRIGQPSALGVDPYTERGFNPSWLKRYRLKVCGVKFALALTEPSCFLPSGGAFSLRRCSDAGSQCDREGFPWRMRNGFREAPSLDGLAGAAGAGEARATARARAAGYAVAPVAAPWPGAAAVDVAADSDSDGGFELVADEWDRVDLPWAQGHADRDDWRCYVVWRARDPQHVVLPGVYVGQGTILYEHLVAAAGDFKKLRWSRVQRGPKAAREKYKAELAAQQRRGIVLPGEPVLHCL